VLLSDNGDGLPHRTIKDLASSPLCALREYILVNKKCRRGIQSLHDLTQELGTMLMKPTTLLAALCIFVLGHGQDPAHEYPGGIFKQLPGRVGCNVKILRDLQPAGKIQDIGDGLPRIRLISLEAEAGHSRHLSERHFWLAAHQQQASCRQHCNSRLLRRVPRPV
jgi:hypothetical protein